MITVLDLGTIPYSDYLALGRGLVVSRAAGEIPDLLLFATHPATITLGLQSTPDEMRWDEAARESAGLATVEVERGGKTTYHGPDQQMVYPVVQLDLGDLHGFVRDMQEIVVLASSALGVTAFRRDGFPGVWTEHGKLASLGLALKQRVTLHGMALNCDRATSGGFDAIIPCGLQDVTMTSLEAETGWVLSRFAVRSALCAGWEAVRGSRTTTGSFDVIPHHLHQYLPDPALQPVSPSRNRPSENWGCSTAECDEAEAVVMDDVFEQEP